MDPIITFPVKVDDFIATLKNEVSAEVIQQLRLNNAIPTQIENLDGLLTREEAAGYFHISLPTLNHYTKSGVIKGYRLGNRVFYKRSELDAALSAIRTSKDRSPIKNRRA